MSEALRVEHEDQTVMGLAAQLLARTAHDPYRFVMSAFPWGQPGTPLADKSGPREWQKEVLLALGEHLQGPHRAQIPFRLAIASGHGIGKSALMAFLTLWGICTKVDTKGIITANTEKQLRTKTWPELTKWYRLCAVRDFFSIDNTVFHAADKQHAGTWRMDMSPWSEHNTEAFAGLHNEGIRILALFDEASAISDRVFEVAEGALTDENTEIIIVMLGNPTRPSGWFHRAHTRLAHRWHARQIDARTVEGTNKRQAQEWIEDYGIDSDFVRVRVLGQFPKSAVNQLIPDDLIEAGINADIAPRVTDPLIAGIDVARFGDDKSVLMFRKGPVLGVYPTSKWRGLSLTQLADEIIPLLDEYKPHYVNVDGGGVGGGLVDILRERGYLVHEVNFGSKPRDETRYANKRTEMWADLKIFLEAGGSIPWDDQDLLSDLRSQTYSISEIRRNVMLLTPKDVMKRDGLPSPDDGDAAALTFAQLVSPLADPKTTPVLPTSQVAETEYVRGWR